MRFNKYFKPSNLLNQVLLGTGMIFCLNGAAQIDNFRFLKMLESSGEKYFHPSEQKSDGDLFESLDQAFDDIMNQSEIAGISAALVTPDGSVWERAGGISQEIPSAEDLTVDHLIGIASNTKSYVAATLLLMYEDGLLDLDDPMEMYLDPIPNTSGDATIRQLLGMRTGFSDYANDNSDFIEDLYAGGDSIWTITGLLETYLLEPNFEVGEGFGYSNTNYLLAGLIIESITGEPWYEEVRDRVLEPLELSDTYFFPFEQPEDGELAHFWDFLNGSWQDVTSLFNLESVLSRSVSAGCAISTAEDLALFRKALHGGELLEESTYAEMVINNSPNEEGMSYGLGIFSFDIMPIESWGHDGAWGNLSVSMYFPEYDFALVTMQNDLRAVPTDPDAYINYVDMFFALFNTYLNYVETLDTKEPDFAHLHFYPNPTEGVLNVVADPSIKDLRVIDMVGNTFIDRLGNGENRLDELSNGTYIVVGTANGAPIKQKLVIAR